MDLNNQGVHVVQLIPPHDHSASASYSASSTTYISMKGYHKALIVANVGSGAATTFVFKQAKDVSGTSNAALSIDGYYTNAAAVASASTTNDTYVYTAYSGSGSSSQATNATNDTVYVFPIDPKGMNVASSMDCVGVAVAAAARVFGLMAIMYPRYAQQVPKPALVD